jgi:hypothetical protein
VANGSKLWFVPLCSLPTYKHANLRSAKMVEIVELPPPPPYEWSQTQDDLTLQVPFPPSTPTSGIVCTVSQGRLTVGLRGAAPIVDGELFDALSHHTWSLEGGARLTLELEKARPRYWPCVLRGDPEVDVAALKAKDKLESEPAYKPHPGEHAHPLRPDARRC